MNVWSKQFGASAGSNVFNGFKSLFQKNGLLIHWSALLAKASATKHPNMIQSLRSPTAHWDDNFMGQNRPDFVWCRRRPKGTYGFSLYQNPHLVRRWFLSFKAYKNLKDVPIKTSMDDVQLPDWRWRSILPIFPVHPSHAQCTQGIAAGDGLDGIAPELIDERGPQRGRTGGNKYMALLITLW